MGKLAGVLISILILARCTWDTLEYNLNNSFQPLDSAFYFYAIGDWGRDGQYGQIELSAMMGNAGAIVEPQFIISTGDNFYPDGVDNSADPQWQTSFEQIYTAESLQRDWYAVLGNHDYRGNTQAQIEYTQLSDRWKMPARYFHKDVITSDSTSIRFVFLDTNPLNDDYHRNELFREKMLQQDTAAQMHWMDSILTPPFDWKIVIGHHPLYTGGSRRFKHNFVRRHVEPLLDKHQVDLYVAGHEHDMQHIKPDGHPTHHFISGAGSLTRPTGVMPFTFFSQSTSGFLSVGIRKESIFCQFLNSRGEVVYETSIEK